MSHAHPRFVVPIALIAGLIVVTVSGPGARGSEAPGDPRPQLLSPAPGALLDNGRLDLADPIVWDFDWADVPGATRYHLVVLSDKAVSPVIDKPDLTASQYHHEARSYIPDRDLAGWHWRVRAMVHGAWSEWSEERVFQVEPPGLDPPTIGVLPPDPGQGRDGDQPRVPPFPAPDGNLPPPWPWPGVAPIELPPIPNLPPVWRGPPGGAVGPVSSSRLRILRRTETPSPAWRSRPTVAPWPPGAGTRQSRSGT